MSASFIFHVESYNGTDITKNSYPRTEALAFPYRQYDCVLAKCLGVNGYRNKKGIWKPFQNKGRGPGEHSEEILKAIMRHPGVRFDRWSLKKMTEIDNLHYKGVLAARICYLRRMYRERVSNARFLVSESSGDNFSIYWPKERTWVIVTPELIK